MPLPPKKLKALVAEDKKKAPPFGKGAPAPEEEEEASDEDEAEHHEEQELDEAGRAEIVEAARRQVENGPEGALVDLVAGYEGGEAPPEGIDPDKWEAASEIVGDDDGSDPDHWLVVAHVYKALGGEVPDGDEDEGGDEMPEGGEDFGGGEV